MSYAVPLSLKAFRGQAVYVIHFTEDPGFNVEERTVDGSRDLCLSIYDSGLLS